ncbi:MAG: hypothetical protein VR76_11210 [Pseudomonas sp. BRH_c35]|nr:MAG: hypothetical protein VR76_11210 [Pseudomonas sp. BRH_c35]
MANYIANEGILSRLGVKTGVLFQHGEDPNRRIMSALAIAAMLSTTITSTAFAMQPPPIAVQAPSYNQVVQVAKTSAPTTTLAMVGKDGALITISSEQPAELDSTFAKTLKKDLEKSIAIFQKTKSWDMVMAEVVAPGLQSKNPQDVQSAVGVLNFYHYSAGRAAGSEVKPATNNAAEYLEVRGPALEKERQVAAALNTLDLASQSISGEITDQTLATVIDTQNPGAFEKIAALINPPAYGTEKVADHLAFYQEYQLSILNQVAQYQAGNPGKMIPSVDAKAAELDAKYPYPMIVDDYLGNPKSHELDIMALNEHGQAEHIRDSFAHPANAKEALQGMALWANKFRSMDMESNSPRI